MMGLPTTVPLTLMFILVKAHQEDVYRNLFEDSLEEFEDVPIKFEPRPPPEWMRGSYVRNGVGQLRTPNRRMKHLFDGFAKLTKVQFSPTPTFTTKFIKSDFYKESQILQDVAPFYLFKSPEPEFGLLDRVKALSRGMDNTMVNVVRLAGNGSEYLALNDIWRNYQFAENLDTLGKVEGNVPGLGAFLSKLSMASAHPVREFGTGHFINAVSTVNPLGGGYLSVIRITSAKQRELVAQWYVERVPYFHSFAVTRNYAVLLCHPTFFNFLDMSILHSAANGIVADKNGTGQIFVVDLRDGHVQRIEASNIGFMVHYINGHELDGRYLVLDAGDVLDSMDVLRALDLDVMLSGEARSNLSRTFAANTIRFTIDLLTSTVHSQPHNVTKGREYVRHFALPVINENYRHAPSCYAYGILALDHRMENTVLVKRDLCNNDEDAIWGLEGWCPTEPSFVATPGGGEEDDGFLVSLVMNLAEKKSHIVLLDARSMTLFSKAELPTHVPWGPHGKYFQDDGQGFCGKKDEKCA